MKTMKPVISTLIRICRRFRLTAVRRRQLVAWGVTLCLLSPPVSVSAAPQSAQNQQKLAQVTAQLTQDSGRFRHYADRFSFLDKHNFDVQEIERFFEQQVALQLYPGVLRGIDGTLQGRAGNAYDQSIALAALFKDTGYDSQVLHAVLSTTQAEKLVMQLKQPAVNDDDNYTPELAKELLQRLEQDKQKLQTLQTLQEKLQPIANRVWQAANKSSPMDQGKNINDQLVTMAQPYYWVRYREADGLPWKNAHPAWPEAKQLELNPEKIMTGQADAEDLHKLSIEVFIETSENPRQSITGDWSIPTANATEPVQIEVLSNAIGATELSKNPNVLEDESSFFYVRINGALPEQGLLFDRKGNTYPGASIEGINSVFSTLAKKGGAMSDGLANLGGEEQAQAARTLQRVWVEFSSSVPAAKAQIVSRDLYVKDHPENLGKFANLHQRWDISVQTTDKSQGVFNYFFAEDMLGALEEIQKLSDPANGSDAQVARIAQNIQNSEVRSRLRQNDQWAGRYSLDPTQISYRHEAGLVAVRQGVRQQNNEWFAYTMTDLLMNRRMSVQKKGDQFDYDSRLNTARGIWETQGESIVAQSFGSKSNQSAFTALENSTQLAPGTDVNAWWQVDPLSGSTIGMLHTPVGLGGSEYGELITLLITLSLSMLMASVGLYACVKGGGKWTCCTAVNGVLFIVGLVLGAIVGAYAAAGAFAMSGTATAAAAGRAMSIPMAFILDGIGMTIPVNCSGK